MSTCEICGKPPAPYPNWIVSKGRAYHLGCLVSEYHQIRPRYLFLRDLAYAAGTYGPWSDGWDDSFEKQTWGEPRWEHPGNEANAEREKGRQTP